MDVKELPITKDHETLKIEHKSKLLAPGPKRLVSIGTSGSGKTRFVVTKFFPMLCDCFKVNVICKNENQECYKALEAYCKKNEIPFEIAEELSKEMLDGIINGPKVIIDEKNKKYATLPSFTLIDDIAEKDQLTAVKKLFKFGRHSNANLAAISQNLTDIPKQIRGNFTNFLIHPVGSDFEARALLNYAGSHCPSEQLKHYYWNYITKPENKYSCIFIQTEEPKHFVCTANGDLIDLSTGCPITIEDKKVEKKIKKTGGKRVKKPDYEKILTKYIKDGGGDKKNIYEK